MNTDHNMTMPQAKFFFVYVLWRDEKPEPLQCHVAFGFDKASTEETRRLVLSGVQVSELLSMSEVHELLPYHTRRRQAVLEPVTELSPGYKRLVEGMGATDHPGTDDVASTLFTERAKVTV